MNKNKIIIILIVLIAIAILISIVLALLTSKYSSYPSSGGESEELLAPDGKDIYEYKEVEKETSKSMLYTVLNCINENEQTYTYVKEIYRINKEKGKAFFAHGVQSSTNKYYIIELDNINETYNLADTTEEEYNNVKNGKVNSKYLEVKDIAKTENNSFNLINISDSQLVNMYFDIIKNLLNNDPQSLYEILDEEYREKRFGNVENLEKYIELDKAKITNMEASKYARYNYDGYIQYVCRDNNGKYYIINEELNTGDYKIFLDEYTIDQPEFIEEYEKSSDSEKAGYNINKFIQSINSKDYNYAYNCLAQSFKQNNFPTLESFEKYVKENFYDENEIEHLNYMKESGYQVYQSLVKKANNDEENVEKDFIVNLKENRDFEMSFEI